jgi:hypothetical protein
MIMGTAEHVNLKKMYPKTYSKLDKALKEHVAWVIAMQAKKAKD